MKVLMWEHFAPGGPLQVGGHHVAARFMKDGAQVAWCAGPVSPVNFIKTNEETRARLDLWRRGGARLHEGRMFAYAPMTLLPWRRRPLLDSRAVARLTVRATWPRFDRLLARAGFARPDLLWMEPGAPLLALLDGIPHAASVYRMCDDTAAFPDTPRSFARIEREVCGRVDLVLATARSLERRARAMGSRAVLYLPNACDPESFARRPKEEPADLRDVPRPRAVYAGALDSWLDVDLLADAARRLKHWSFVLIGPARADLSRLAACSNVRVLGSRAYLALPGYLAAADAGIVPFRLSPLTHAIHAIKIYEYCAAGLPVVATPMEETVAMGAPLLLADGGEAFAAALESARAADGPEARAARLAFARRNTWDIRYETLRDALPESARLHPAGTSARSAREPRLRSAAGGAA
jgi:glycosyltransferase involved in cell wall biosynthesis